MATTNIWLGGKPRGTWSSATVYNVNDLVQYTSAGVTSTYICLLANTNQNPSALGAYWAVYAGGAVAVGAWQTASLTNSWAAIGSPYATPRYRLELDGVTVRLSGAIKNGTPSTSAFTLGAAFRPTASVPMAAIDFANIAPVEVTVTTAGSVIINCTSTSASVSLESLTFPTN